MKVATWNVNGIRARASQVREWLEHERPDVICLQELKAELAQVPEVVQWQDYHACWHCCKGHSGVYVPNGGKDYPAKLAFFNRLIEWARELRSAGRELLICGDLNVARTELDVHPKERKPMAVGQRPEERALFEQLLGTGLTDVGRAMDPDNTGPLYLVGTLAQPPRAQHRLAARLPARVPRRVRACAKLCSTDDVGTSDHAPVVMTT